MYNESYDEYIRNILGYPNYNNQDYYANFNSLYGYNDNNSYRQEQVSNIEVEDLYPEIYKIVYPMVKKSCRGLEGNITKEKIIQMEEELYSSIEGNTKIDEKREQKNDEKRQCINCNNGGVRDIIRILLLRELLGRPNRPNNKPPFPPPPRPRPPFFPNGQSRPPFPRGYDDIYEY